MISAPSPQPASAPSVVKLGRYSFGLGDRFEQQTRPQLEAIMLAQRDGVEVTPVWNKSYREHQMLLTRPVTIRQAADEAVSALGWSGSYFVDADHITLQTVPPFVAHADFFTIDVSEHIGQVADKQIVDDFVEKNRMFIGDLRIAGLSYVYPVTENSIRDTAHRFLQAAIEAARVYEYLKSRKGEGTFITEVSMDEVEEPQTPVELFFMLSALAYAGVRPNTIAPKFVGQFNKGVDYVGNLKHFRREFEENVLVVKFAIEALGLPADLKISMHSGSDKFSIYPAIRRVLLQHEAGLHVKTAGTTFLEELIGLARGGADSLELVKSIYVEALSRFDEITAPHRHVIDVQPFRLPTAEVIALWSGDKFADTLRYHRYHPNYNPAFRQFMHCAYRIAGEKWDEYIAALKTYHEGIATNVVENIYEHHLRPLFIDAVEG